MQGEHGEGQENVMNSFPLRRADPVFGLAVLDDSSVAKTGLAVGTKYLFVSQPSRVLAQPCVFVTPCVLADTG